MDARIPLMYQGINIEPRSNALARAMQLQGQQQQNKLMQLQMQEYERKTQEAEVQRQTASAQKAMMDAELARLQPVRGIDANRVSGVTGPRPEALNVVGQKPQADPLALLRAGFDPKMVEFIMNSGNLGRPEVARTVEVDDGKGGKATMQVDKFGQPVGQSLPGYIAPVQVNQGDRITFAKPQAGTSLPVGMSPEARDASARGWANVGLSRDRLAFDKSQVVPGGKPSAAQERADLEKAKAGRQGEQMLAAINEARSLLAKNPTASGIGAAVDAAGRFVGMTSDSAKAAAQLETLSGWMVANVPRMEGPQSNFDVENYKVMAAKVGDRSTPIAERLAALSTLEGLHRKYADINGTPLPAPPKLDSKALMSEADRIIGIGN